MKKICKFLKIILVIKFKNAFFGVYGPSLLSTKSNGHVNVRIFTDFLSIEK